MAELRHHLDFVERILRDYAHGRLDALSSLKEVRDALENRDAEIAALKHRNDRLDDEARREGHAATKAIDLRDYYEDALANAARELGCEEEWSNAHCHGKCVPELAAEVAERARKAQGEATRLSLALAKGKGKKARG